MSSEPIILHDHVMGGLPKYRSLVHLVESLNGADNNPLIERLTANQGGHRNLSRWLLLKSLVKFRQYGQQVFCVGEGMQEMFHATSLKGIPTSEIKLPYPAFYVALPDCPWKLWGGVTGWHKVEGVSILQDELGIWFFIWAAENENSETIGDDAQFWWRFDTAHAQELGMDIETFLDHVLGDPDGEVDPGAGLDPDDPTLDNVTRQALLHRIEHGGTEYNEILRTAQAMLRIVLNLTFYLQSADAETTPHPRMKEREQIRATLARRKNPRKGKSRSLAKRLEQMGEAHITWVGRSVESWYKGQNAGGTRNIRGHWVRGHWWPKVPTELHPKRQWRNPYPRCMDSGDTMKSRHYKFEEDSHAG